MRNAVLVFLGVLLIAGTIVADRLPGNSLHAADSDVIFAHADHTDVDCTDCHADIESSERAEDFNFPTMDVCGDCHDVDDDEDCGICHRNADDPQTSPELKREIVFSHKSHIGRGTECGTCHGSVSESAQTLPEHMPGMKGCFSCHDNFKAKDSCELCHAGNITLLDIHPADWRHIHEDKTVRDRDECLQCHTRDLSCLECHRGDNLLGNIHDLNYLYIHGLDAKSKLIDCSSCHDNQTFCYDCHARENRIPLLHSSAAWILDHGRAARRDPENCASCHDSADPTCGRGGCHLDADGLRGTDNRFHSPSASMFSSKGAWHNDDGHYCYVCHTNTHSSGIGFCGYCHQ